MIDKLFGEGESFFAYPYKYVYLPEKAENGVSQVLFVIPKRVFRKASDRNLMKRRLREAYRLNRESIRTEAGNLPSYFAVIQTVPEKIPFLKLQKKLNLGLRRLINEHQK